jgi:hypothetical protein
MKLCSSRESNYATVTNLIIILSGWTWLVTAGLVTKTGFQLPSGLNVGRPFFRGKLFQDSVTLLSTETTGNDRAFMSCG